MPLTAPRKYWDRYDRGQFRLPDNFRRTDDGIPRPDWDEPRRYGDCPTSGPMPEEKAREIIHGYHASITFVDEQVGQVLDELKRLGLERETIVVVWSDNGWRLGQHGRWSKPDNSETCTRVMLAVSAPGGPRNVATDALLELVDIYPSLCELCGLPLPDSLEEQSFVPLLADPARSWKEAAFSCLTDYTTRSIRTDRWRFVERESGRCELRDHNVDPDEDRNLVDDPSLQGVVDDLRVALRAGWRRARSRAIDRGRSRPD